MHLLSSVLESGSEMVGNWAEPKLSVELALESRRIRGSLPLPQTQGARRPQCSSPPEVEAAKGMRVARGGMGDGL